MMNLRQSEDVTYSVTSYPIRDDIFCVCNVCGAMVDQAKHPEHTAFHLAISKAQS